jgi:hypothetical protein
MVREVDTTPHPKGKRVLGSCAFLECTEEAGHTVRVVWGSGLMLRQVISVCDGHARALDEGMTVLLEFHKG